MADPALQNNNAQQPHGAAMGLLFVPASAPRRRHIPGGRRHSMTQKKGGTVMGRTFCVAGHDPRQLAAAEALRRAGCRVVGAAEAARADAVLFPAAQQRINDETARILQAVRPGTLLLAGRPGPPLQRAAREAGLPLVDYLRCAELETLNAIPTAEGCLALLLELRGRTIWESDFLVLGYGRIARALARRLVLLGAGVTAAARSPVQRAEARGDGCRAVPLAALEDCLPGADTVINTIPALVLPRPLLEKLPQGALVVDLASRPGGVDFASAARLGIRTEHALALPGRYAPATAGALTAQAALHLLQDREGTV